MFEFRSLFYQLICLTTTCFAISRHPIIVLVAFDGFRPEYADRGLTPTLQGLAKTGVRAPFMYNIFPTVTWPNFFSIATGMYPETHGVFANQNFDRNFKCVGDHHYTDEFLHYNDEITPLWTLNEMSGDDRYSATLFWPTSQVAYRNHTLKYNVHDERISFRERVDMTVDFIRDPNSPANLVFLYFNEPDYVGHIHGPNSIELNAKLRELDDVTKYLLDKLTKNDLRDKVNLMFLSDHGMVEITPTTRRITDLDLYIRPQSYSKCGSTPVIQIHPLPAYEKEIYENLTHASRELNTFTVYRQEELPEHWHLKNSKRISEIWIIAKMPFLFTDAAHFKGEHGYEDTDELRPIFFANGPLFKSNYTVTAPFKNIDIYPFISSILHLRELPKYLKPNGTLLQIQRILRDPIKMEISSNSSSSSYCFGGCMLLVLVCYILVR